MRATLCGGVYVNFAIDGETRRRQSQGTDSSTPAGVGRLAVLNPSSPSCTRLATAVPGRTFSGFNAPSFKSGMLGCESRLTTRSCTSSESARHCQWLTVGRGSLNPSWLCVWVSVRTTFYGETLLDREELQTRLCHRYRFVLDS